MDEHEFTTVIDLLNHLRIDLADIPEAMGYCRNCCVLQIIECIFADLINEVYFPVIEISHSRGLYRYESVTNLGDLGQFTFKVPFPLFEEED